MLKVPGVDELLHRLVGLAVVQSHALGDRHVHVAGARGKRTGALSRAGLRMTRMRVIKQPRQRGKTATPRRGLSWSTRPLTSKQQGGRRAERKFFHPGCTRGSRQGSMGTDHGDMAACRHGAEPVDRAEHGEKCLFWTLLVCDNKRWLRRTVSANGQWLHGGAL